MLLASFIIFSQEKMITTSGTIIFDASFPSFDEVKGTNSNVTFVLNPATGEIASLAIMKGFEFKIALMEEHFNENYMESEKYPYATFKGKINEELDLSKTGVYSVGATGVLNIHGVDQERKLSGKLTVGEKSLLLETQFEVMLIDHKIEIPKLVFKKIAEKIEVKANISYSPYTK